MPPWDYLPLHPEARLSDAETSAFLDGLTRTFGAGESGGGERATRGTAAERAATTDRATAARAARTG